MADWTSKGWFRHRISSTSDPKFGKLVRLYGAKGYAVYFMALEFIYDGELGDMEVETIADILKMNSEEVVSILETCSESCAGLLSKNDDGTWTSSKATELLSADEEKREEKREKVREYRRRLKSETERTGTCENETERSPKKEEYKNLDSKKKDVKNLDFKKGESKKGVVGGESCDSLGSLPPKKEAVEAYMHSIGKTFDVDRFMDYYSSLGWKLRGEPIRDVEALIRRWPDDHITHNVENHPEYREIEESSRRTL